MEMLRFLVLDPEWEDTDHPIILQSIFHEGVSFCACNYFTCGGIEAGEVAVMLKPRTIVEYNMVLVIAELELFPFFSQNGKPHVGYGVRSLENLRSHRALRDIPILLVCENLPQWSTQPPPKRSLFSFLFSLVTGRKIKKTIEERFAALKTLGTFSWKGLREDAEEQELFRAVVYCVLGRQEIFTEE